VSYVTEKRFLTSHNASLAGYRPAGGKYAGLNREERSRVKFDVYWPGRFGGHAFVVFFLPAAIRAGNHAIFVFIISVLAVTGVGFMLQGLRLRDREE